MMSEAGQNQPVTEEGSQSPNCISILSVESLAGYTATTLLINLPADKTHQPNNAADLGGNREL